MGNSIYTKKYADDDINTGPSYIHFQFGRGTFKIKEDVTNEKIFDLIKRALRNEVRANRTYIYDIIKLFELENGQTEETANRIIGGAVALPGEDFVVDIKKNKKCIVVPGDLYGLCPGNTLCVINKNPENNF
jgi:hypothetical protein